MSSFPVGKQQQLWIDHFDSPDKLTQAVKGTCKPRYIIVILSKHSTSICHFPPCELMKKENKIRDKILLTTSQYVYHN